MAVDRVKLLALRQTVGVYGNVDPGQIFFAPEETAKELVKMHCAKLVDQAPEEKLAPEYANKAMQVSPNKAMRGRPRLHPRTEETFTIRPDSSPLIDVT